MTSSCPITSVTYNPAYLHQLRTCCLKKYSHNFSDVHCKALYLSMMSYLNNDIYTHAHTNYNTVSTRRKLQKFQVSVRNLYVDGGSTKYLKVEDNLEIDFSVYTFWHLKAQYSVGGASTQWAWLHSRQQWPSWCRGAFRQIVRFYLSFDGLSQDVGLELMD